MVLMLGLAHKLLQHLKEDNFVYQFFYRFGQYSWRWISESESLKAFPGDLDR